MEANRKLQEQLLKSVPPKEDEKSEQQDSVESQQKQFQREVNNLDSGKKTPANKGKSLDNSPSLSSLKTPSKTLSKSIVKPSKKSAGKTSGPLSFVESTKDNPYCQKRRDNIKRNEAKHADFDIQKPDNKVSSESIIYQCMYIYIVYVFINFCSYDNQLHCMYILNKINPLYAQRGHIWRLS